MTEPSQDPAAAADLDFTAHPAALAELLDRLGEGCFSVDATGRVTAWSRGAEHLTELHQDAVVGRPAGAIRVAGERGFRALVEWLHADADPGRFELRFAIQRADGSREDLAGKVVAIRDGQGELEGAFGMLHPGPPNLPQSLPEVSVDLRTEHDPAAALLGIVGRSQPMQEVFRRIRLAAHSEVTTLITGESGTGKELAARALHALSSRREQPFLAVNCGALTESLLESELFGHEKGAFTGALREHRGVLEQADHGTLFLDEIGEVSAMLQVKLLRALQERQIRRVGGSREIAIDVRLITATNKDLDQLVQGGAMREDFYYRVRVYEIAMPPLRERRGDILPLVEHFCREFNPRRSVEVLGLEPEAERRLLAHDWPGNVRELKNAIEHAYVSVVGDRIAAPDLPPHVGAASRRIEDPATGEALALSPREADDRQRILATLERHDWNRTASAQALGYSRVTLWKKMRRYRIDEGVFRRG
ncbi:MAG: sigma 54-interacting transcriptional regulator [Planctomycetes bacterium]|nr:sigma 54-interacting transcriptional regulator [Planctomycetota bacterium]